MPVRTLLKHIRLERGWPAAALAARIGVTRQTIYAIEDGTFVPNTVIALQLAQLLEVRVEDLFSLEGEPEPAAAALADLLPQQTANEGQLVRLCRVGDGLQALPVTPAGAFLPDADGTVHKAGKRRVSVISERIPEDGKRLLIAGCDPALSLLGASLKASGMEIVLVPCSSKRALEWLKQGRIHAAGSHLADRISGDYNVPVVRKLMGNAPVHIVTFASWEMGLVVQRGNPKSIRAVSDLGSKSVRILNREEGSGSRDLLDRQLRDFGIDRVRGYDSIAPGHLAAARSLARGEADCCVAPHAAARCFGLDFIPLATQRFDLTFSSSAWELPAAQAVLDVLSRSSLRRKLRDLAGYDAAHSGDVLV